MRDVLILLLWLLSGPVGAEDTRLTPAEVTEVGALIETVLTGTGDFALAEAKARDLYTYVLRDFGAQSPQALQIEWLIVLAVTAQGRTDEGAGLGQRLMVKAQRLLTADDPPGYKCAAAYAVALRTAGKSSEPWRFCPMPCRRRNAGCRRARWRWTSCACLTRAGRRAPIRPPWRCGRWR